MASNLKVGFLGAGRMASALARGFIHAGLVGPDQMLASDVSEPILDLLGLHGRRQVGILEGETTGDRGTCRGDEVGATEQGDIGRIDENAESIGFELDELSRNQSADALAADRCEQPQW